MAQWSVSQFGQMLSFKELAVQTRQIWNHSAKTNSGINNVLPTKSTISKKNHLFVAPLMESLQQKIILSTLEKAFIASTVLTLNKF